MAKHSDVVNGVFVKQERESGKLHISDGAWTINLKEYDLKKALPVKYITETQIYEITGELAKERGFIRTFGGEPKLVVSEKFWNKRRRGELS